MRSIRLVWSVLFAWLLAGGGRVCAQAIVPQARVPLFNGTSLSGLYPWFSTSGFSDPSQVFRVENGKLHVTGSVWGALTTNSQYRDYVMVLEFKWGAQTWGSRQGLAKDGGLLFHSRGVEGGWQGLLMPSIQAQMIDGGIGDVILLKGVNASGTVLPISVTSKIEQVASGVTPPNWNYRGGYRWKATGNPVTFNQDVDSVHWTSWDPHWDDVQGYRGQTALESPDGQWNQMIVIANNDTFEIYLNGTKVNEGTNVVPSEGKIQLESELAEYFVRRWELWPLGSHVGPSIRNEILPAGAAGQSYQQQVGASGGTGSLHWSVSAGTLPPDVTLNTQTGAISGTPPQAGAHAFTVTVTDDLGLAASQNYLVSINNPIPVTTGIVLNLDSTQGVTAVGNQVTTWADVSGNAKDVTAVGEPQWGTVLTPLGLQAIHLDGVNDRLQRTTSLAGFPTGNTDRTMFLVAKYNSSTASGGAAYGTDNLNQAFALSVKNPSGELVLGGYGSANDLVSATPGKGAGWLVQSGLLTGGAGTLFKDGTQIGQFTHTYGTVLTKMIIGADLGNAGYVGMDVAAVLLYNRALSASERADVNDYLRSRYLVDTMPPTIVVPENITAEAAGSNGAVVSFSTSAVDSVSGILSPTNTPASGSAFPVGTTMVNVTATDGAGNVGSGSFTVTVQDTTPPVIMLTGANPMVVSVGGTFADPGATAMDNVDGDLTSQIVMTGGPVVTTLPGSYTLTYNVMDAALNAAVPATRTVNVVDTTPPVITRVGANPLVVSVGAAFADPGATATDNVDGNLTSQIVMTGGPVVTAAPGSYTLTYNVSDAAMNAAAPVTRTVNVVDTTPPVITLTGANPLVVGIGASFVDPGATATDNVDGNLTSQIVVSGGPVVTTAFANYTLTYNVHDAANNAATPVTRTVNVRDITPPVITIPANLVVQTPNSSGANVTFTTSAIDNVSGVVSTTSSPVSGSVFPVGTTTVTTTAVDAAGNNASRTFTVTVELAAQPITPQSLTRLVDKDSANLLYTWSAAQGLGTVASRFNVQNGILHVVGNEGGGVISTNRYQNYVQVVEYKWGPRQWGAADGLARNSGILIHCRGYEGGHQNLNMPGLEVQLAEGSAGDFLLEMGTNQAGQVLSMSMLGTVGQVTCTGGNWNCRGGYRWISGGTNQAFFNQLYDTIHWYAWDPGWLDVTGYRGAVNFESTDGQWNQAVIEAQGGRVSVWLNGTKVNEILDTQPSEGKVQIENEGSEYFIRRWELNPLGSHIGPSIRNDTLPGGTAGQLYQQQIGACAGTGTLHWAVSAGSLPPNVTLNTQTGALSGTPPQPGAHAFTVTVTDDLGLATSQNYLVSIGSPIPVTAGLVLRLDSAQGITGLGNTVSTWADLSGNGNNLSGVNGPDWGTVLTPTGIQAVHLDGSNDKLQRTAALTGFPSGNTDRTLFVVAKYNSSTASGGVGYGTDNLNQAFSLAVKNPSGELVLGGYGNSNDLVSTTPGKGAGWLVQSGLLAGGVGTLFKDGTQIGQFTHTYGTVVSKIFIGADLGNAGFVGMDVAAVLLYNRALSVSERADVNAYLRSRYLVDTMPPTIVVPENITAEATGSNGAVVSFNTSAVDSVSGILTPTTTPASGSLFPLGTTTVTTSAVDAAGNPANASFTVTVVDTTAPVITLTGSNPLTLWVGEAFVDPGATALDLVDGNLTSSIVPGGQAVDSNTPGSYLRTYTVSDSRTNTSQKQRTVQVVPAVVPQLYFEFMHNETDDLLIGIDSVFGLDYELRTSTDLIQWDMLDAFPGDGLSIETIHTGGGAGPRRFYKVIVIKSAQ